MDKYGFAVIDANCYAPAPVSAGGADRRRVTALRFAMTISRQANAAEVTGRMRGL